MKADREMNCFVFTMDTDWADDETLDFALRIFEDHEIPVTVFATNLSEVLTKDTRHLEVGIHPAFQEGDDRKGIADLLALFPRAKGVRSHGLYEYSGLFKQYKGMGLEWDASQQLYLCSHLRPYAHPSGMVRLPMYWEDDDYFSLSPDWRLENLKLERAGVKCFDFHPIHLRLNTSSERQYSALKEKNFTAAAFKDLETRGEGTRTLLERLLDWVSCNKVSAFKAGEVCGWV